MISLSADLFMIELTGCRYRRTFTTDAIVILHRRTFYRAVRTKDTAVARLRAQQGLAVRTFVEKLARVGRHRFSFHEAANGTHQHGFKKDFAHTPDSLASPVKISSDRTYRFEANLRSVP